MPSMIICIISSNLDSIPDGHEREADKEAEGASDRGDLVKKGVLDIEGDLGDDVGVKEEVQRHPPPLVIWLANEAEEEVRHLAVVPKKWKGNDDIS